VYTFEESPTNDWESISKYDIIEQSKNSNSLSMKFGQEEQSIDVPFYQNSIPTIKHDLD